MNQKIIIEMLDHLEEQANDGHYFTSDVRGIVVATASFVEKIYSRDHIYYLELQEPILMGSPGREYTDNSGEKGRASKILSAIRKEAESGLLFSNLRELVSSELFSDHLEMAEYLLDNDYKDLSALMIGTTLEIHLRQLCETNSLEVEGDRGRKPASRLNEDLYKSEVYGKLDFKQVIYWLEIRNNAAHGEYDKYDLNDVRLMLEGVKNFISKPKQTAN